MLYLYHSKNQLTTTSQNKWKEGWIKSDENWKQTWINSALNFICSANPNDSKLNFSQANEFRKLTKKAVGKRIRDSFAQDSSKCQNWKLQTVGIWIGERCSCSGTKLQFEFRGNIWYAYRNYFKRVHCKSNIPAVVIMFVQRINIPGYNVYTDLNQKNLFKTVDSYFMIL